MIEMEILSKSEQPSITNGTEKVYNQDHNFLVHNSCLPKISVIAPDWVTKGAHIHFDDIELAVRPDG